MTQGKYVVRRTLAGWDRRKNVHFMITVGEGIRNQLLELRVRPLTVAFMSTVQIGGWLVATQGPFATAKGHPSNWSRRVRPRRSTTAPNQDFTLFADFRETLLQGKCDTHCFSMGCVSDKIRRRQDNTQDSENKSFLHSH